MTPGEVPLWVMLSGMFVLGGFVGRWINAAIDRLPRHEFLADQLRSLKPRRRWWEGNTTFNPLLDRLPFVGWMRIRRRGAIPRRYQVMEFLTAICFALLYYCEIPHGADLMSGSLATNLSPERADTVFRSSPVLWLHLRLTWHLVLVTGLLIATAIDFETYLIPDGVTVPLMFAGIIGGVTLGHAWVFPVWFQDVGAAYMLKPLLPTALHPLFSDFPIPVWLLAHPHWHGLLNSVVGLLLGGGAVWLLRIVSHYGLGQEGIGFGDVTLMAAVGSVLGWQIATFSIVLGALCALVIIVPLSGIRGVNRYLPYGPFLAMGTFLSMLTWNPFLHSFAEAWYGWGPVLFLILPVMVILFFVCLKMVRGVQSLLGIAPAIAPWEEEAGWFAADQNHYLSQENVDRERGLGCGTGWEGDLASRGQLQQDRWSGLDD